MNTVQNGKGSKRRPTNENAVTNNWPDFKKKDKYVIDGEILELTYTEMVALKRKNPKTKIEEYVR